MSYTNQFRVKWGVNPLGQPQYWQGTFWSEQPFSRLERAIVNLIGGPFVGHFAEVHQSTPTQKGMSDFSFNGVRVQ